MNSTAARLSLIASLIFVAFAATANAAPLVYVVTQNIAAGTQSFGTLDLTDGSFTPIGNGTTDGLANLVYLPNGHLLSLATNGSNAGYLATIDPKTGEEHAVRPIKVGGQPLGFNAFSLAEVFGAIYVTDFSNNLYSVNLATGNATRVRLNGDTTLPPDPNVPFTSNSDGTVNLCDESFYGSAGKLYAIFDSFAADPSQQPPIRAHEYIPPYLWQIDPFTGAATFIAVTDWQLAAIVEADGQFYAFKAVFLDNFPAGQTELDKLDIRTGATTKVAVLDASLGLVFGAVPVR
jgi:hypothetical protein